MNRIAQLRLGGNAESPVKHLYVAGSHPKDKCAELLDDIVHKVNAEAFSVQGRYNVKLFQSVLFQICVSRPW